MAQTDEQEYWRKDPGKGRKVASMKWHIGDTETSTWCRAEEYGGSFAISTETPPVEKICKLCLEQSGMVYAL